jgi:hypothetical protein
MLGSGRRTGDNVLLCLALDFPVRDAHALVLAQVLEPGFVHEAFDEARRIGRIVEAAR